MRPRKLYKHFSSVLLENKDVYGKESMKSDYAFLCAENRGLIHAESPAPAHITEINLKHKIVWVWSYSYKKACYQNIFLSVFDISVHDLSTVLHIYPERY